MQEPTLEYTPPANGGTLSASHKLFLEVIRQGALLERNALPIKRDHLLIGRLPSCHVLLEHPSVSRKHAILQFSPPNSVYVYDLGSAHGTRVNKDLLPKREHVLLHSGDQIRFGESSRVFVLVDDALVPEDEPISKNIPIRAKAIETEVTWGFHEDAEDEDDDVKPTPPANAPYASDPRKYLSAWLHRNNLGNLDFEEDDHGEKLVVTDTMIHVPTRHGTMSISGRGRAQKKKDAERDAAMMVLIRLEKRGLLQEGAVVHGKKRRVEEDEFDDGMEDMYDETNKPNKKRAKEQVETFESLKEKLATLETERVRLEQELTTLESSHQNDEDEDDIDAVLNQMLNVESQQRLKKIRTRLQELPAEKSRLERLLAIAAPQDWVKDTSKFEPPPVVRLENAVSVPMPPLIVRRPPQPESSHPPEHLSSDEEKPDKKVAKAAPQEDVDFTKVEKWQDQDVEDATGPTNESVKDLNKLYGF